MFDVLFPRKCVGCRAGGSYFCVSCRRTLAVTTKLICPVCGKRAIGGKTHSGCENKLGMNGLVSVFSYDGAIRSAVKKLKFRFITDLVNELVKVVSDRLDEERTVWEYFKKNKFIATGVPLHVSRLRWRGFNQADEIGERIGERMGLEFVRNVLARTRDTQSQAELVVNLSKSETKQLKEKAVSEFDYKERRRKLLREKKLGRRLENVKQAFKTNDKLKMLNVKLKTRKVLLIDDVWTSGATMRECAKVLKRSGAREVWGFTVAR